MGGPANGETAFRPDFNTDIEISRVKDLIPIALQQLRERFGLQKLGVSSELEAAGALWSACTSFQRHCSKGEFTDATNCEELAGQLVRIAYNRAQRQADQDRKMSDATRYGITRNGDGQPVPVDFADKAPGPQEEALRKERAAYLREAIHSIKEELQGHPFALEIIQAYLADMKQPQKVIAKALGINQATVSRWIAWFHDRIRHMLEENEMP